MEELSTHADLDADVLTALSQCPSLPTYVIRNTLVMGFKCRKWPSKLPTSRVRRSCRRLEAAGHVKEVHTFYAVHKCWAITASGRAALQATEHTNGK